MIKKVKTYYEYHGLLETIKAIIRKIFHIQSVSLINQMKNFDLNSEKQGDSVILKSSRSIFIFATVPYYDVGGGQRSAQLAKIFNKMGFNIFYIYAFECSEDNVPFMSIPVSYHKNVKNVSYDEIDMYARKNDIFIFEAPTKAFNQFLALAKLKKCKVVYENIDNWETSLGSILFDRETLENMIREADMIVATAQKLVEQTENYVKKYSDEKKKVYYLPNAVDDELFDPRKNYEKPNDLILGEKNLLYYGSLWGEWFDWEIIKNLAKDKTVSITLIGDYSGIKNIVEEMPENVHFLGLKKQTDLPSYLKYVDYAILPFKPGEISDYVSPLKIFEYISMGKIILTTNLPDMQKYPNIYSSNNINKWNEIINTKIEVKEWDTFITKNNWYARCTDILDTLFTENSKKADKKIYNNLSIIVLNYNNKQVITRCIDTLLMYNSRYNYEIIIVDNQSTDGSYELLEKKYKGKIKLIKNQKNGCSSGRNLGVENSTKEYILFLDSDQWILNKYWIDNYINLILNDNNIGAVAWNAGWFNNEGRAYKVVDGFGFRYMEPNILARKDIGYLATCGFMMEKQLFEKIKGFDINYDPTCYEDTDLSLKIRNSGKEIYYSTYLGVGHLPHQTTKSGSAEHTKLINKKADYFYKKWSKQNKKLLENYIK